MTLLTFAGQRALSSVELKKKRRLKLPSNSFMTVREERSSYMEPQAAASRSWCNKLSPNTLPVLPSCSDTASTTSLRTRRVSCPNEGSAALSLEFATRYSRITPNEVSGVQDRVKGSIIASKVEILIDMVPTIGLLLDQESQVDMSEFTTEAMKLSDTTIIRFNKLF